MPQVGFGITNECYLKLKDKFEITGVNESKLIRKMIDNLIFNESWVELLTEKRKPISKLSYWRAVHLKINQYDRIIKLTEKYNIARSEIIRRVIEDSLYKSLI